MPPGGSAQSHGAAPSGRPQIPPELLALTTIKPLEGVRRIGGERRLLHPSVEALPKALRQCHRRASANHRRAGSEAGRGVLPCPERGRRQHCGPSALRHRVLDRRPLASGPGTARLRCWIEPPPSSTHSSPRSMGCRAQGVQRRSGLREPRAAEIESLVDRLKVALRYDFGKAAPADRRTRCCNGGYTNSRISSRNSPTWSTSSTSTQPWSS